MAFLVSSDSSLIRTAVSSKLVGGSCQVGGPAKLVDHAAGCMVLCDGWSAGTGTRVHVVRMSDRATLVVQATCGWSEARGWSCEVSYPVNWGRTVLRGE